MTESTRTQQGRKKFVKIAIGAVLCLATIFSTTSIIRNEYTNYAEVFVLVLISTILFRLVINIFFQRPQQYSYNKGMEYLLVIISLLVCLAGLEVYLWYYYQDTGANPQFITHADRELNERINEENRAISRKHPHGFNDRVRPMEKAPGVFRVAVLGDSFIWGDGLPYDQIWSHKLERLLLAEYPGQVEVLSWGLKGWSTLDEYIFLKQHGLKYHLDLLIIGFVTNDTDMGLYKQQYFRIQNVSILKPLRMFLPNAIDFVGERTESLLNRYFDIGYENWERKLYQQENLNQYRQLINNMAIFCKRYNVEVLFVNTPPNCDISYKNKFDMIASFLKTADITYLDMYPAMVRDLGRYPPGQLRANLANGHPGPLVTEVYAQEVFAYLKKNHLSRAKKD